MRGDGAFVRGFDRVLVAFAMDSLAFGNRYRTFSRDSRLTKCVLHAILAYTLFASSLLTSAGCPMTTTHETATINRVAGYFQKPLPEIPDNDFDRQAFYTESILQAVAAMRGLLTSGD